MTITKEKLEIILHNTKEFNVAILKLENSIAVVHDKIITEKAREIEILSEALTRMRLTNPFRFEKRSSKKIARLKNLSSEMEETSIHTVIAKLVQEGFYVFLTNLERISAGSKTNPLGASFLHYAEVIRESEEITSNIKNILADPAVHILRLAARKKLSGRDYEASELLRILPEKDQQRFENILIETKEYKKSSFWPVEKTSEFVHEEILSKNTKLVFTRSCFNGITTFISSDVNRGKEIILEYIQDMTMSIRGENVCLEFVHHNHPLRLLVSGYPQKKGIIVVYSLVEIN